MRIIAIAAAYNEERFIAACIENLVRQGILVYLIDNGSTDRTVAIAERYRHHGLIDVESFPREGNVFRWRDLLIRKEVLASTLDGDWFIHVDPDQILLPPRGADTLAEAFAEAEAQGYNAANFWLYEFVPTREAPDHDHGRFQETMRWYYSLLPFHPYMVRAWKRQPQPVDLRSSAGHVVQFAGRRISPELFRIRHYLFLSVPHAIEKYSKIEYDPDEVKDGWHGWRARLTEETVQLPRQSELRFWNGDEELDPPNLHITEWLDGNPPEPLHLMIPAPDPEMPFREFASQRSQLNAEIGKLQAWSKELLGIIAARDRELDRIRRLLPVRLFLGLRRLALTRRHVSTVAHSTAPTPRAAWRTDPAEREILFLVDIPNWAIDRKAGQLIQLLSGEYRLAKRYPADLREDDLDRAALIVVFFWMQIAELPRLQDAFERNRHKLLLGVCSQFELEGERCEPGMDILRRLPRAIFVNNSQLHEYVRLLVNKPVFYTPNGVDTLFFAPSPDGHPDRADRSLRVGWAGSLSNQGPAQRGFYDLIVPAVAKLPRARLLTAVREEKWRTPVEMRDFYRSLDVYLCASRSEGTPNPCLEAAASGVPVVTTRVGNMPDFLRDGVNGFFIEPSIQDIAAKLRRLEEDTTLRSSMGRAARAAAQLWDWGIQANNYRRMFHSVLNPDFS